MPKTTHSIAEPVASVEPSPRESSLFMGSLAKAFQVLEAFRDTHREMSLAEIARAAQLDRSATQRIIFTLEKLRYIRRLPDSNLYTLAPEVLRLSYNYLRSQRIVERAYPYLIEMTHTLGETSNLQEMDGNEVVFIAKVPGRYIYNSDFSVGSRLPAAYTASGRAMMAKLPMDERLRLIASTPLVKITAQTVTDPEQLLRGIEAAERDGYAIVQNQTVVGDISVAAAITGRGGVPIGAITISAPSTRWGTAKAEAELLPHVLLAATSISNILDNF